MRLGIESIDQETLNAAHKAFNKVKNFERNIKRIQDAGINVVAAFIFGFDQDTPTTLDRIYDFAMDNRLAIVNLGVMTPFPGTEVFKKAQSEGRIFDRDWEHYTGANLVQHHPTMSKKQIEELHQEFPKKFYTFSSIAKRFWANRSQPLYYLTMNFTHWWRAHHRKPQGRLPSVPPAIIDKDFVADLLRRKEFQIASGE